MQNNNQARHQDFLWKTLQCEGKNHGDLVQSNLLLSTITSLQMSSLEKYLEVITTSKIHAFLD